MTFYAGRPHDRSSKGLCRRDIADCMVPRRHNADLMVIEKSSGGLADTERGEIVAAHDGPEQEGCRLQEPVKVIRGDPRQMRYKC